MDVKVIHKGTIKNGIKCYDYPKVYQANLDSLEGKRFEETLEAEHEKVTNDQWAYLYGGIIRGTCMKSDIFSKWTFEEIKENLVKHLRTGIKIVIKDGKSYPEKYEDDLKQYSIQEMSIYIEDVLNFLAELDIHPLPSDYYKYGVNVQFKK
jgi:hypothetical protein